MDLLDQSKYLAIVPGLTTIYETFLTGNRTLLLPSTNYSQVLQTDAVIKADLAGALICDDIFGEINEKSIIAGEVFGTEMIIKQFEHCNKTGELYEVFYKGLCNLLTENIDSELSKKRYDYVSSLGDKSIDEVINDMVRIIEK